MTSLPAIELSKRNRQALARCETAGCYHCVRRFPANAISHWTDNGQTATCPFCGIDSVLAEVSGVVLSVSELSRLREEWFQPPPGPTTRAG